MNEDMSQKVDFNKMRDSLNKQNVGKAHKLCIRIHGYNL